MTLFSSSCFCFFFFVFLITSSFFSSCGLQSTNVSAQTPPVSEWGMKWSTALPGSFYYYQADYIKSTTLLQSGWGLSGSDVWKVNVNLVNGNPSTKYARLISSSKLTFDRIWVSQTNLVGLSRSQLYYTRDLKTVSNVWTLVNVNLPGCTSCGIKSAAIRGNNELYVVTIKGELWQRDSLLSSSGTWKQIRVRAANINYDYINDVAVNNKGAIAVAAKNPSTTPATLAPTMSLKVDKLTDTEWQPQFQPLLDPYQFFSTQPIVSIALDERGDVWVAYKDFRIFKSKESFQNIKLGRYITADPSFVVNNNNNNHQIIYMITASYQYFSIL